MTPADASRCLTIEEVAGAAVQEREHERVELLRAVLEVAQRRERVEQVQGEDGEAEERGAGVERAGDGAPDRLHAHEWQQAMCRAATRRRIARARGTATRNEVELVIR